MVTYLCAAYAVSERRACRTVRCARATYHYRSHRDPRTMLRQRIREMAQTRVRYGYRKIRVLLNREGWAVGKKLVCRIYRRRPDVAPSSATTTEIRRPTLDPSHAGKTE